MTTIRRSIATFTALLTTLTSCYAHVPLEAPKPTATPQERIEAYEELAPTQVHRTQNYVVTGYVASPGIRTTDYMRLKGGAKVHFPEDLLPIVPEGSSTALRAMESVDDRSSASWYSWLFVGSMVGGSAVAVVPLFTRDSDDFDLPLIPLLLGLGIVTVGGLWGGIGMTERCTRVSSASRRPRRRDVSPLVDPVSSASSGSAAPRATHLAMPGNSA